MTPFSRQTEGRSNGKHIESKTMSNVSIDSQCISILSYAIEVIHVADRNPRRRLRVIQLRLSEDFRGFFSGNGNENIKIDQAAEALLI